MTLDIFPLPIVYVLKGKGGAYEHQGKFLF